MTSINRFTGKYDFLSNFYYATFQVGDITYQTVEHAYQAAKTLDRNQRDMILLAETPGKAKRLGYRVILRSNWEYIKVDVMYSYVFAKFAQNQDLAKRLLATELAELVEGNNWHDNLWGNCYCPKCASIPGQNLLGKILMEVRAELLHYQP